MSFKKERGAILIITLWILAILTILSVGVAGRMGLELKLTGLYRDNMKALYLAKAGIERAIAEKEKDDEKEEKGEAPIADILNESWANKKELFDKQNPFIGNPENNETPTSYYTVKYTYKESIDSDGVELYGMMDEASKININKIVKVEDDAVDSVRREQLIKLLEIVCGLDPVIEATPKVDALIDWMDTNDTVQGSTELENTRYYADTGVDTYSKNSSLESIEELLLIYDFDSTILYGNKEGKTEGVEEVKHGIFDYITIYTEDGKVNVNTAPKEVLEALGFAPDLAQFIIDYRKNGPETGDSDDQPIEQSNLNINFFKANIFKRDLELVKEEPQIKNIITNYLTATSTAFRINAYGKVNKAERRVNCIVMLEDGKDYNVKYWKEQ